MSRSLAALALLRAVLDGTPLPIGIVDARSSWVALNPAMAVLLGRQPGELVGRDQGELVHPGDRRVTEEALRQVLEGREQVSVEARFFVPLGGEVLLRLRLSKMQLPSRYAPLVLAVAEQVSTLGGIEESRVELAGQLLRAREDERSRIAGEVHDDPLQWMVAASLQLQLLESRLADVGLAGATCPAEKATSTAIGRLRALLVELHPPSLERGDLLDSIREYGQRFADIEGPQVTLESSLRNEPSGPEASVLFRVAREALANTHKHAKAKRVALQVIERRGGVELVVADDGQGFDSRSSPDLPGHFGLASMRARAASVGGHLEVESRPGAGTKIRMWIPRLTR